MEEIWKDIPNYKGLYQASSLGRIKSLARTVNSSHGSTQFINERIRKYVFTPLGYYRILLLKCKVRKIYFVHRLVAITFIENPDNKPQINHKDGNKLNNNVDNLEWCTQKENSIHAWSNGLQKPYIREKYKTNTRSRKVLQFDMNGNFIKKYNCLTEAAECAKTTTYSITMVANNKRKHANKFKWIFDV
jgi:hypothetical protein